MRRKKKKKTRNKHQHMATTCTSAVFIFHHSDSTKIYVSLSLSRSFFRLAHSPPWLTVASHSSPPRSALFTTHHSFKRDDGREREKEKKGKKRRKKFGLACMCAQACAVVLVDEARRGKKRIREKKKCETAHWGKNVGAPLRPIVLVFICLLSLPAPAYAGVCA
jgi:hypothetical protein